MTRFVWMAALLVSSTVSGCGFDLTAIERRQTPYLTLNVSFGPLGAPRATARFHPGFTHSGQVRAVSDDSLRINGAAIAPKEITQGGRASTRLLEPIRSPQSHLSRQYLRT